MRVSSIDTKPEVQFRFLHLYCGAASVRGEGREGGATALELEQADVQESIPVDGGPALEPVEPGYKNVLRVRMALLWLILWAGGVVCDLAFLKETAFYGLPTIGILILATVGLVATPRRIYDRLRYRLTDRLLQVVRGWLFHVDTIVPLVRVQHIDVTRGPVEKIFGVATLVVHTAGTHNSVVTLPGLSPDRAAEIRDIIREHVRTDFA
jgi:membrane protein YdbS with pleckstrin-like domain